MGGGYELTSPDPHAYPPEQVADYTAAVDQGFAETVRLFEDAVWYLEAAGTPEEILVNLCTVLSYAHALLGLEYHEQLSAECQAWQCVDPAAASEEVFVAARDRVVREAWQLDGSARTWLANPADDTLRQAYDCLAGLGAGSAEARQILG